MAYRNKTYVCFDADHDIHWYRLMQAWKENENIEFNFHNAHEINNLRGGSSEETIKRKLRERLKNTKVLVVLIGDHTRYLYKYVRWEMEWAVEHDVPVVAVNLNGKRVLDEKLCPPIIREELAIHICFGARIMDYALNNWPATHVTFKKEEKTGAYWYKESVYSSLGL